MSNSTVDRTGSASQETNITYVTPDEISSISGWWRLLLAFLVVSPICFICISGLLIGYAGYGIGYLDVLAFLIFLAAFGLRILVPFALYFDARDINKSGFNLGWKPRQKLYFLMTIIPFVPIGYTVTIYYMYQRHKHLRVPSRPQFNFLSSE